MVEDFTTHWAYYFFQSKVTAQNEVVSGKGANGMVNAASWTDRRWPARSVLGLSRSGLSGNAHTLYSWFLYDYQGCIQKMCLGGGGGGIHQLSII